MSTEPSSGGALFQALPPSLRASLDSGWEAVTYRDGEVVVRAGEPGDAYFLITAGTAEVLTPLGAYLATLAAGQGFGELALLLDRPRTATVVARGPLACMRLAAERFRNLLDTRDPMLAVTLALASRQADDIIRLESLVARLKRTQLESARALAASVEARDAYTGAHVTRCGRLARLLAAELGLPASEQEAAELAGVLHDVGKVAVPDAVLRKPGTLDAAEFALVQVHPLAGFEIVRQVELLLDVAGAVRSHHERWDGRGYPDGLAGDAIPPYARIVSVVDAYDAMTSDRPYRLALPREHALREIADGIGGQFAAQPARAFLDLARRGILAA